MCCRKWLFMLIFSIVVTQVNFLSSDFDPWKGLVQHFIVKIFFATLIGVTSSYTNLIQFKSKCMQAFITGFWIMALPLTTTLYLQTHQSRYTGQINSVERFRQLASVH